MPYLFRMLNNSPWYVAVPLQPVTLPSSPVTKRSSDSLGAMTQADYVDPTQQPSLGSVLGHGNNQPLVQQSHFQKLFPDMRQGLMSAIQELNEEVTYVIPLCIVYICMSYWSMSIDGKCEPAYYGGSSRAHTC
jgi:hypothetical protein